MGACDVDNNNNNNKAASSKRNGKEIEEAEEAKKEAACKDKGQVNFESRKSGRLGAWWESNVNVSKAHFGILAAPHGVSSVRLFAVSLFQLCPCPED